jgi:flagellar protein FlaF
MHATEMAKKGYANTQKQMSSDLELELKIFTDITGRIAGADIAQPGGITALNEALADNARLWNIVFLDVTNKNNLLNDDLKGSLIYLAEFTREHTIKVLRGEAGHQVLIEVNNNVIAGKRTYLSVVNKPEAA